MNTDQIYQWLTEAPEALNPLWQQADKARRDNVGDSVHLRGLLEISNHCQRQCSYCGIRAGNNSVQRYRMSQEEILACARAGEQLGYGTVVLQAGESQLLDVDWVSKLVTHLKKQTNLAITLSLGERSREELVAWYNCGADRYLLRFETSNKDLFQKIHPPLGDIPSDRISLLETLSQIGYATGSGMLIGIPGQSYQDLVNDLLLLKQLNLHMIGIGPYVPDPDTPLGQETLAATPTIGNVVASESLTYRVMALARILCPKANIPSTTAVATLFGSQGQDLGLQRGANVLMPNITPQQYRTLYKIYPAKACLIEPDNHGAQQLRQRIELLGRKVGCGRGDAPLETCSHKLKGSR
jgi:biotin synthase